MNRAKLWGRSVDVLAASAGAWRVTNVPRLRNYRYRNGSARGAPVSPSGV